MRRRKTKTSVSIIFGVLALTSCGKAARLAAIQDNMNVVWEDEDGLFSIAVHGSGCAEGIATISMSGESVRSLVLFDAVYGYLDFNAADNSTPLSYDYQMNNGAMVLRKRRNETGDSRYDKREITLRSRSVGEEEVDAVYFTYGTWANEETKFRISIPCTGYYRDVLSLTKKCTMKDEEMDFNFLGNKQFSITAGESTYAYGSYSTYLSGDFELHVEGGEGKEALGSDVYLTNSYK